MRSFTSVVSLALCTVLSTAVLAQEAAHAPSPNVAGPAAYTGVITRLRVEAPLSSRATLNPAVPLTEAPKDGRSSKNLVVPGKDRQTQNDILASNPGRLKGRVKSREASIVFDVNNNVSPPSDPTLGVGPDHVFIVFNTGFIIYDKDGNDLTGPLNVNNIFSANGCCDLTASYDAAADRWVISYLFFSGGAEVAVSQGPDPLTTAWNVYTVSQINDYQKLSVWSDGYYITDNTGSNNRVWALERSAMLAGAATPGIQSFNLPGIVTSGFQSPQVLNVTDANMPAAGGATAIYLQDDAWGGVAFDHIKVWTIDVDWTTPGNSTVSAATQLAATPFISVFDGGSFSNLAQPGGGGSIDALQATIMNQAQFRKFPGHNSAVFNFVVDADATAGELAAVRWYELRQPADNTPWAIEQEGTYTAENGKHAWNASLAMDQFGNIGMGYTSMAGPTTPSPTSFRVSSYYTGRFAGDPAGTMTVSEQLISAGTGNISGNRFGDYGKIDVDPVNGKEFWYTTEYIHNGGGADVVGVFQIASDFTNDVGVITIDAPTDGALTNAEQVTVTVFNYGQDPASGFDVSYQVDGGTVITEPYVGTLASAVSAQHTFATTSDLSTVGQTYALRSYTSYVADEFNGNDTTTRNVTHLLGIDVGVTAITSPSTGSGLTATESVIVTIKNFGSATQTSVPVFYTVNGGTPVLGTYTGSIAPGASANYTFTTTANLSALGTYGLVAGTEAVNDGDPSNDDFTKQVTNNICQPVSDCAGFNDGVTQLQLADQNIQPACGAAPDGYSYEPGIVFNFVMSNNPFVSSLEMGYDDSNFAIWIDFNDNFTFEASERIATGAVPIADTNFPFTVNFTTLTGVTSGMHLMRVRGTDGNNVQQPCADMNYGRTNDYTANITGLVGIATDLANEENLTIRPLPGGQFLLTYSAATSTAKLPVSIYDAKGRLLAYYTLANNGGVYSRTLDMSHTSAGVYMVKVGTDTLNVMKRIVVE
ncbi:MAG: T9SS type A sorting domain-containing protein [Flavobacteriales bacterium]|nr:T9SS type A sorting domain-containing protein [Flavobacteriales bacterium]